MVYYKFPQTLPRLNVYSKARKRKLRRSQKQPLIPVRLKDTIDLVTQTYTSSLHILDSTRVQILEPERARRGKERSQNGNRAKIGGGSQNWIWLALSLPLSSGPRKMIVCAWEQDMTNGVYENDEYALRPLGKE